jgi:hypothetical protein
MLGEGESGRDIPIDDGISANGDNNYGDRDWA